MSNNNEEKLRLAITLLKEVIQEKSKPIKRKNKITQAIKEAINKRNKTINHDFK